MFYFLSLLMGILISVMILVNGGLTEEYGVYSATVIIHIVGLLLVSVLVIIKKEQFFPKFHPWFFYLGGAFGVLITVANNFAFGRISVSAILALGLLGQSIASIVIDQFGLLGMQRHPFKKHRLIGIILVVIGIRIMTVQAGFEFAAILLSFKAGVCIVASRTLNAGLASVTSVRVGTFYNYLVGLVVSIPVLLMLGGGEAPFQEFTVSPRWYIYIGGVLGVWVVLMSNVVVKRVAAFYLTLLVFVGQISTGIVIDSLMAQEISFILVMGGSLVAAGLCANLFIDKIKLKYDNPQIKSQNLDK